MKFNFLETETEKILRSPNTNYNFNKLTGYTEMWGKTKDEDIIYSDVGPHILDLEISTICDGYKNKGRCPQCYKITPDLVEQNMSFETFKKILDSLAIDCFKITFENGSVIYATENVMFNVSTDIPEDEFPPTDDDIPTIPERVKDISVDDILKTSEGFLKIVSKEPAKRYLLQQIAFGSGSFGIENPEVFEMMSYARSVGIIPNITVANLSDESADKFSKLCGAMSVSCYSDRNVCYDTIKKLTDRGMKQVNIHFVVHKYSKNIAIDVMKDMMTDERLKNMNAIVLLSLKKKGNGEQMQILSQEGFNEIVNFAFENKIKFGMDSCSGAKFINSIHSREDFKKIMESVEPCESTKISSYINVAGKFYSCSFCENTESFKEGVNVLDTNFVKDVWENKDTVAWRNNLLEKNAKGDFSCPVFEV